MNTNVYGPPFFNASKQFQPVDINHHDVGMSRVEGNKTRKEVYMTETKTKLSPRCDKG
jgi:hypothetical protein